MPRSSYSWQNLGVKFCCCKQFSEYVSLSSLLVSLFVLLVPADCKHQEEGQITFAMSGPSAQNTIYKYIDYLELVMLGLYRHYCLFLKFLRQLSLSVEVTSRVDGWQSLCFFDSVFYCLWWVLMMIELLIWDICLRFWHVPASKARDETDQIFECFEKESVDVIRAFELEWPIIRFSEGWSVSNLITWLWGGFCSFSYPNNYNTNRRNGENLQTIVSFI